MSGITTELAPGKERLAKIVAAHYSMLLPDARALVLRLIGEQQ